MTVKHGLKRFFKADYKDTEYYELVEKLKDEEGDYVIVCPEDERKHYYEVYELRELKRCKECGKHIVPYRMMEHEYCKECRPW